LTAGGTLNTEGALAIHLDAAYRASVKASVPPSPAVSLALWGPQELDYYFPYQGPAMTGTIQIWPRKPRVRAQCATKVVLSSGKAALRTRLLLQPEIGTPQFI